MHESRRPSRRHREAVVWSYAGTFNSSCLCYGDLDLLLAGCEMQFNRFNPFLSRCRTIDRRCTSNSYLSLTASSLPRSDQAHPCPWFRTPHGLTVWGLVYFCAENPCRLTRDIRSTAIAEALFILPNYRMDAVVAVDIAMVHVSNEALRPDNVNEERPASVH
jgi:hypothetical protein